MVFKILFCLAALFNTVDALCWPGSKDSWKSWGPCSESCSGGTQTRSRYVCVYSNDHQSRNCNEFCYNGGTYSSTSGCRCTARRTGRCCHDYRPCSDRNGGCAERCLTDHGGSRCGCRLSGYKLSSDGIHCVDINECSLNKCDQLCTNTAGSFNCACHRGYLLQSDKTTCEDKDECNLGSSNCAHSCHNNQGSYTCSCRGGYTLDYNGHTCTDINECQQKNGDCAQNCINTQGQFHCECNIGFTLDPNNKTCTDIDECFTGVANCEHSCKNSQGSFKCTCRDGYLLGLDGRSCSEINECETDNGGCPQRCINEPGSFHCGCNDGYRQGTNGKTCTDIDECSESTTRCSQMCRNTMGSYTCACRTGFTLKHDGVSCEDIDECIGATCYNGGICKDNVGSYSCNCKKGFTGKYCENDVNECMGHFKGGCEDVCINIVGSYHCSCSGNKTLQADMYTCTGGANTLNLFERHGIVGHILQRGCHILMLTRCSEGKDIKLFLSSTAPWYQLISNASFAYTDGIVFVELNQLSLPVSLTGMQVIITSSDFLMSAGSTSHTPNDGKVMETVARDDCLSFDTTARDIHDILTSGSFLKSFFTKLESVLPDWLQFSNEGTELIELYDLKTELTHGRDIENDIWCSGAPVIDNHLYNIFKFGGNMSISLYGNIITLPKPLKDSKFCFIVDICQDYGGSIFLILPKESRNILEKFELFQNLRSATPFDIRIHPRGIGLSLYKHINVHHESTSIKLWNGDTMFNYPVFPEANIWLGGDVDVEISVLKMTAQSDLYISLPLPFKLLKNLFMDEWDVLFKFRTIASVSLDAYASLGGNISRQWCGTTANPPGLFLSFMADVNPFHDVPILKDWVIDLNAKVDAFFTTDPDSKITSKTNIDIFHDIMKLDKLITDFVNITLVTIERYSILLAGESVIMMNDLMETAANFGNLIVSSLEHLAKFKLDQIIEDVVDIWENGWKKIESDAEKFIDSIEFNARVTKYNFTELLRNKLNLIKQNIKSCIVKLGDQVYSSIQNYEGFGLKFTASLDILGHKLAGVELEMVHSVDSLGSCGKFKDVYKIFEGKKATRIYFVVSRTVRLYLFLRLDVGDGVGMALSVDAPMNFVYQIHAQASMLGIDASTDLFINNNGLYFYIEGTVWNTFKAQIKVSANHDRKVHEITLFRVQGKFVANAGEDDSFQDRYLDGLRKILRTRGDNANKRITQAQQALTKAQNGMSLAQDWLEEKKDVVRSANVHFDNAVNALEHVKDKLEEAKGPFEKAIQKLNEAQRNVDNLCRIKTCSKVCIPGLKCHLCHKRVLFVNIPYPCCHWTSCMISFPNPICVIANLACRAVRGIAYIALGAAKLFVRVPMLALDVAKAAVSAAEVVVDKSRFVLDIAVGLMDIAQVSLEGAKSVLELAKFALEGVKIVEKVRFYIFEQVIKYGLQSLIDVKNCGFDIEMSTRDLPIFDVSCDVNVFHIGWKTFRLKINFQNTLQTMWQAAKTTISVLLESIGNLFTGRRKREIMLEALTKTHRYIRMSRESEIEIDNLNEYLNETIDIVSQTTGFKNYTGGGDYENRVEIFKEKCARFQNVFSFLNEANGALFGIAEDTNVMLGNISDLHDQLNGFNLDTIRDSFTLEGTGINADVAMQDYNISIADLNSTLADAKLTLANDPLLSEIHSMSSTVKSNIKLQSNTTEEFKITDQWLLAMENVSADYFEESLCVSFLDCAHYSIATLYELFVAETLANTSDILTGINTVETLFLDLTGNSSHKIPMVYNLTSLIGDQLQFLEESVVFCSEAPSILSPLSNQTITRGSSAVFVCNVTADPEPTFWWYKDDEYIPGQHDMVLTIYNVTDDDARRYRCVAGNVVANLTLDDAHVNVTDEDEPILSSLNTLDTDTETESNARKIDKPEESVNLAVVLASTVSSVFVVAVVAVVVCRACLRYRFRKKYKFGHAYGGKEEIQCKQIQEQFRSRYELIKLIHVAGHYNVTSV